MNNIQENSLYYNPTCLHTKLSDLEVARNLHKRTQNINAQDERLRRRMEEITSNPAVVLSEEEYATLTPQQKGLGWVSEWSGPSYAAQKVWRRQRQQDRQSALELTIEWRLQNVPNIKLSEQEYARLTPQQRELGWVSDWSGPSYALEKVWRRRTQSDINNEHNSNIRAQMNSILSRGNTYHITNYNSPLPELAIRNDRDTYVQLTQSQYNDYKRLESQLRN
jgi:DNA repair ATPase RecN